MLLAEALAERAQAQERLNSLKDRLAATVRAVSYTHLTLPTSDLA